jgi:hypothetical protein
LLRVLLGRLLVARLRLLVTRGWIALLLIGIALGLLVAGLLRVLLGLLGLLGLLVAGLRLVRLIRIGLRLYHAWRQRACQKQTQR